MPSVYQDPPKTEGGDIREISETVKVYLHDLEEEGILMVVENKDKALHVLKFDFSQCENLKVDTPASDSRVAKTDRFKVEVEVPPGETMNLCHLKPVDLEKGGFGLRYRVAASRRNAEGDLVPVSESKPKQQAPVGKLPEATGPAAGADRKPLNEFVTLLLKDVDDAYLLFLESERTATKYEVTLNFSESKNMEMDPGPDVELTGELTAKTTVPPMSRLPLARMRVSEGDGDATLKYKVNIKPLEE